MYLFAANARLADGKCIYDATQTSSPSHVKYYDWWAGAQILQLKCVEDGAEQGFQPCTLSFTPVRMQNHLADTPVSTLAGTNNHKEFKVPTKMQSSYDQC